jgi:predicted permease
LEASTGISRWSLTLTGYGDATVLTTQAVDAEFFRVLRVQPVLGRPFREDEREPGISDVVILSHDFWQARFGGDPQVVGRRIDLDGSGHSTRLVIGIMPKDFVPPLVRPGTTVNAWIPLSRAAARTIETDSTWYVNEIIGRLVPEATVEQATQQIRTITTRLLQDHPGVLEKTREQTAGAIGLLDSMVGDVRTPLLMLLGGVGLVMLLVCANLANLLLARGERRRRELAVRSALGAGRLRLVREQLTDSVLLALIGGAGGILVARVMVAALDLRRGASLPRAGSFALDWPVMIFAVVLSFVAALTFGLLPAIRGANGDLRQDLGAGSRGRALTPAGGRGRAVLVAGEIALATILVSGAGLLLKSIHELRSVDAGLDPADVFVMELSPPSSRYDHPSARVLYDQLFERLRAIPRVRTVGAIHLLPFTPNNWGFPYLAEGHPPPDGPLPIANFRIVTPEYFDVVDQPLLEGRGFTDADLRTDQLTVGLINRTMAKELWPDEPALGKVIRLFGSQPFEVIGVVGDARQFTLDRAPVAEMYVPHTAGWSLPGMVVMIEADDDLRPVMHSARQAVGMVDENIPIVRLQRMDEIIGESIARRRFFANVLSFFGVLALSLGAVGVFGVMAYTMGARRAEFGIRMALGATRSRVLGRAMSRGMLAIGVGLAAGLLGSTITSRLLQSLLFGVTPDDLVTRIAVAVVLGAIAAAATFIPAYRATRIDAATVMRSD